MQRVVLAVVSVSPPCGIGWGLLCVEWTCVSLSTEQGRKNNPIRFRLETRLERTKKRESRLKRLMAPTNILHKRLRFSYDICLLHFLRKIIGRYIWPRRPSYIRARY